jgi:ribose transport system permease protein
MLHVSTPALQVPAAQAVEQAAQAGPLLSRYLLLPPIDGAGIAPVSLNPLQQVVFAVAMVLALLTFTVRLIVAEALSVRLGAFLYVFVSALILLLFVVVADQSRGAASGGTALQGEQHR